MRRLAVSLCILAALVAAPRALACWATLDSSYVAATCPVVVSGKIEAVREAAARAGGRVLDVACIRVEAVHKNLIGADARVGGIIEARMHSPKDTMCLSTDLRYPVGTRALWMLYLGDDGAFTINRRPEQCQRDPDAARKIRLAPVDFVRKGGGPPFTPEAWVARQRAERRREAQQRAAREERLRVRDRAIREIIGGLFDDGVLQPGRLPSLLKLSDEARSHLVNRKARELGISRDAWISIHCHLARHDPIESHRVRALPSRIGGSDRLRELLLESLADRSPTMRLFACHALLTSDETDPELVAAVARCLRDGDRQVQAMAVRALGRMGSAEHVAPILALYRQREPTEAEAADFGRALAQLGQVDVPLACFRKAVASDNWNIRHFAVQILELLDSPKAVPAAVAALPGELDRTVRDKRAHGIGDRTLRGLVRVLAARTGQKHGTSVLAWLDWWQGAAADHGAEAARYDPAAIRKLQDEYRELFDSERR